LGKEPRLSQDLQNQKQLRSKGMQRRFGGGLDQDGLKDAARRRPVYILSIKRGGRLCSKNRGESIRERRKALCLLRKSKAALQKREKSTNEKVLLGDKKTANVILIRSTIKRRRHDWRLDSARSHNSSTCVRRLGAGGSV